jgi:hypothetical protein
VSRICLHQQNMGPLSSCTHLAVVSQSQGHAMSKLMTWMQGVYNPLCIKDLADQKEARKSCQPNQQKWHHQQRYYPLTVMPCKSTILANQEAPVKSSLLGKQHSFLVSQNYQSMVLDAQESILLQ